MNIRNIFRDHLGSPRTSPSTSALTLRLALAAAVGLATACGAEFGDGRSSSEASLGPEVIGCEQGGEIHPVGDVFTADDGCNTCVCGEDGALMCTLRLCLSCLPALEPHRTYVSQDVEECTRLDLNCGEGTLSFSNDCGCGCERLCSVDGEVHRPGENFPSSDGCNTCTCGEDGQVLCTKRACFPGEVPAEAAPK